MKKYLIIILICCGASVFAQHPPRREDGNRPGRERVEAMKVGFLTQRLDLNAEEAKVFWPVYNKYQDELETLRKSRRENLVQAKMNVDSMSDKDVEKAVDAELGFRQSELDLQKKYHGQFKQVLPVRKVAKLYRAEEDFKRELLDRIKDNKQEMKRNRMEKR